MYKQILDNLSKEIKSVQRLADNAFIPFDPANTDYIAYLAWITATTLDELKELSA
jgi:hypothetical protein